MGISSGSGTARWCATAFAALAVLTMPIATASALDGAGEGNVGPVITSHMHDQRVSGQIEVAVQSSAPHVRIVWAPEVDAPVGEYPTETVDGVATQMLSTSGHAGPTTVLVRECSTSDDCDGAKTHVQVVVSNAPPRWDDRTWLDEFHDQGALWAVDEDPWGWYGFFIDGEFMAPVFDVPFVGVDPKSLGDGEHTVQVAHCTERSYRLIEPVACDTENASEVRSFTVRTALHPNITDVQPRTITPGGHGADDAATVTVMVDAPQFVEWRLHRASVTVVSGPAVWREAGSYTFTVNGLDGEAQPLPAGLYELEVGGFSDPTPAAVIDDRPIWGRDSTTLEIVNGPGDTPDPETEPELPENTPSPETDRAAPRVTQPVATPRVFYPRRDGFRDRVRIAGTLSERAPRLRIELVRAGKVRHTLRLGPRPRARFAATWNGRNSQRKLFRPGPYRYRFVVADEAGNMATRSGGWIRLRWGR